MDEKQSLDEAIRLLGGVVSCAEKLRLKNYQTLQQWRKAGVPAEYCPAIERATEGKVRCEDLRPDVDWAYLRGAGADHAVPESIAASTGVQPGLDCSSGDLRHKDRRKSEKRAQSDRRSTEQKAA